MKRWRGFSWGIGSRSIETRRGHTVLPAVLIEFRPLMIAGGGFGYDGRLLPPPWRLQVLWGLKSRFQDGYIPWREEWAVTFRWPVRLLWRYNEHWSRAWTGRACELLAFEVKWRGRWYRHAVGGRS